MRHHRPVAVAPDAPPKRSPRFAVDLMEHLVVPGFVLDASGRVVIWNRACERLTGVPAADVLGTSDHWQAFYVESRPCLADLVRTSRFDEIHVYYSEYSKVGLTDFGVAVENWCDLRRAGRRAYLAIDAGPIYDEAGAMVAVVETLRDITTQREAQDALETLATCDGLTGLANRRRLDQALDAEANHSARTRASLSLLMMDIDGFKLFNDTYGHGGGDDCLRRVAHAVAAVTRRAGDLVARYGGEEFAAILPNTDAAGALDIAERIRRAVEDLAIPHRAAPVGPVVTLSIGGATAAGPDADPKALLAAADAALYRAKRAGRNRSVVDLVPSAPLPPHPRDPTGRPAAPFRPVRGSGREEGEAAVEAGDLTILATMG